MVRLARARGRACLVAALVALGVAGGLVTACENGPRQAPTGAEGAPIDPTLLAFLGRARAAHHRADLLEDDQPDAAVRVLDSFLHGPVPQGGNELPEVREVLADTHARLADLTSQRGEFDRASQHVERGLALAPGTTYLRGHLFEIRGLLEERRARHLQRAARELLAASDDALSNTDRAALAPKLARATAARAAAAQDAGAEARAEQREAERSLDAFRRERLPPAAQARYEQLDRDAQSAVERALQAFETSMDIQARVIESRTAPAPSPARSAPGNP